MFVYNHLVTRTNILESGDGYMKLKIVDMRKFIRSLAIVMLSILFLLFTGLSNTYSKGEVRYKEQYIYQGDTLWSIAQQEAKQNKYYENEDIRIIVNEIRTINNMDNSNLKVGQKIKIPTF